jgi:hypothetical protein
MRLSFALALVVPLVASCTPYIPMKADFGTTAAVPQGPMPPEYAKFNNYDPKVNGVLADQICATPYRPDTVVPIDASPGQLVHETGTCATHQPVFGNGR